MAKCFFGYQKKSGTGQAGFTLIEIILAMLILAVAAGGLLNLMVNFSSQNTAAQDRRLAVLAAKELMEEIKSKRFDQLTDQTGSGWSVIGRDAGESASDKSTYNDVDDYNGWSETLTSPYAGLTRSATVTFVTSANPNTASASRFNDYKKITVQVSRGTTTYAQLVTVVSAAVDQAP